MAVMSLPTSCNSAPHASVVEHPEYIAERIIRFAERVGRENVIASTDCGFSSQATYRTEVEPRIVWTKLKALCEGARIASGVSGRAWCACWTTIDPATFAISAAAGYDPFIHFKVRPPMIEFTGPGLSPRQFS